MQQCNQCDTVYISDTLEVCENCGIDTGDFADLFRSTEPTLESVMGDVKSMDDVESDKKKMQGDYKYCSDCEIYMPSDKVKSGKCPMCKSTMTSKKFGKDMINEEVITATAAAAVIVAISFLTGWFKAKASDKKKINVMIFGNHVDHAKQITNAVAEFKDMEGLPTTIKFKIVHSIIITSQAIKALENYKNGPDKNMKTARNEIIWQAGILLEYEHPSFKKAELTAIIKGISQLK